MILRHCDCLEFKLQSYS